MPANQPKSLYRSIYRQLSRQHTESSKVHLEKDKQRTEALRKYALLKARASGQPLSSLPELEDPKVARYDSNTLRSIFLQNSQPNGQAAKNMADSVATFLESQRMYNFLLEYYNGSTIDEDKRLELSARRVGLELPDALPKEEK